jgi:hypothetical protein
VVSCAGRDSRAGRARGRGDRSGLGASGGKDKRRTFTLEALTTEQEFEGTGLGDQIVFTTQLLRGDTEVGHQGGLHRHLGGAR